jgi:serine/threonine-protein kinase/endoribonuclease IRE1
MSLLNSLLLSLLFSNIVLAGSIATRTSLPVVDTPRFLPPTGSTGSNGGSTGTATDSLELLDIALVASVDGKFHALDRNSGRVLWSMTSTTSSPSALAPLVRTSHVELDGDDEDEEQEQYIIEPQSGDIYVLSSPTAALQRLPFSMASLVEMSPFSFSSDDDRRVFVGKKETTLLVLELETGKLQATINSECPWEADVQQSPLEEIDLDELEDASIPPRSAPTTVFIGRTGAVYTLGSP